ncbi:hypothetical protein Aperf_G00000013943 [Anoplocephala perfoliata]
MLRQKQLSPPLLLPPPQSPSLRTPSKSDSESSPTLAIVLGILIPLLIIIIALVLWCCVFRKRRSEKRQNCLFMGKLASNKSKGNFSNSKHDRPSNEIEHFEPPALSYLTEIPAPIALAEFSSRLQTLVNADQFPLLFSSFNNEAFTKRTESECRLTQKIAKQFRGRNRYADVLPYDQSLVLLGCSWNDFRLRRNMNFTTEQMGMHYINASYIRRPFWNPDGRALGALYTVVPEYIATQAPLNGTTADFLQMVYEQRSPLIIMLCPPEEKANNKYCQYWPDNGKQTFSSERCAVEVSKISESFEGSICIRKLMILPMGSQEPWEVTHFQYLAWTSMRPPEVGPFYELINMHLNLTRTHPVGDSYGPTVVHCSAGLGRSGTLITTRFALEQLRSNPAKIDIIGIIMAVRKFRPMMVQTHSQMRFIFEFIEYCIRNEHITSHQNVPTNQFMPSVAQPISGNDYTNIPGGDEKGNGNEYTNLPDDEKGRGNEYTNLPDDEARNGNEYNNLPDGVEKGNGNEYNNLQDGDENRNGNEYNNLPEEDENRNGNEYNNLPDGDENRNGNEYNNLPEGDENRNGILGNEYNNLPDRDENRNDMATPPLPPRRFYL